MTHPVYAAIARERARYDTAPDDLAGRTVERLHTEATHDVRAAEVVTRLQQLAARNGLGDSWRAGVVVAEHFAVGDDYAVRAWAARYGAALLRARNVLDDPWAAPPVQDPDGDGLAWSPDVEAAVAQAVALVRPRPTVVVLDPTRRTVRRG